MDFHQRYKYDIYKDLLGKGQFISVYKAHDTLFDRNVALKFFKRQDLQNFGLLNEIRRFIHLTHPNVVRYYDADILNFKNKAGKVEQYEVGVMEYVNGGNIYKFLKTRPDRPILNEVLKHILQSLIYIHDHGIIHRDVKPLNILMHYDANKWIPKIADFGISKWVELFSDSKEVIGTVEYMAPEQFNSKYGINGKESTNVDLWSFGVLLTEILYGKPFFGTRENGESSTEQIMSNILNMPIPDKFQGLNSTYNAVIKKCLVREEWNRVQNAQELIDILEKGDKVQSAPASNGEAKAFRKRYQFDPNKDLLGKGGFSKTYKAFDTLMNKQVALKFFTANTAPKYGILAEIKRAIALNHPNIREYYDIASFNETDIYGGIDQVSVGIIEYVNGGTFNDFLKTKPHESMFREVMIGILKGLGYLHQQGIIHRDMKPDNILMHREGNTWTPKIHDFGISKTETSQTASSELLGTAQYMAPEQFDPKYGIRGKISTNVDLWSLGVIMTEIFMGKPFFGKQSAGLPLSQIISNVLHQQIPDRMLGIPEPYHTIVKKCLVRDAKTRARSADELLVALKAKV